MKEVSARLYGQIDRLIEKGARDSDIIVRLPYVKPSDIEQVRRTRGNATPETKRKKKKDPLLTLQGNGSLDHTHIRAAVAIREGYSIKSQDVEMKIASLEARVDIIGHRFTDASPRQIMLEHRYNEWHEECNRRRLWIDPVLYVLTKYVTLLETDYDYNKRKGFAKDLLIKGLQCYCDLFHP